MDSKSKQTVYFWFWKKYKVYFSITFKMKSGSKNSSKKNGFLMDFGKYTLYFLFQLLSKSISILTALTVYKKKALNMTMFGIK